MPDWLEIGLRALAVVLAFVVFALLVGQLEHKLMAHMQSRLGPMYAGAYHGWAQLVADAVKFIQKEDTLPRGADTWVYRLAPGIPFVSYMLGLAVIPIGYRVAAADVDASLLVVLAASAIGVLGTLMGGWASGNKYSLLGGMRAAAQLISYELPLVLAAASSAILAGSLNLFTIGEAWQWYWPIVLAPAAVVFLICGVSELKRPPFDMPLAESELVNGPYNEYGGMRFAMFLLSEYAGIVVIGGLFSVLFLGGTAGPAEQTMGWLWMLLKTFLVAAVMVWIRVAWPRLREDQLQSLAWKILVPVGLAQLVVVSVLVAL